MKYDPSLNLAKGNMEAGKTYLAIGSFVGMSETVQWIASLWGLQVPEAPAQFICATIVAAVAWVAKRKRNLAKHGARA